MTVIYVCTFLGQNGAEDGDGDESECSSHDAEGDEEDEEDDNNDNNDEEEGLPPVEETAGEEEAHRRVSILRVRASSSSSCGRVCGGRRSLPFDSLTGQPHTLPNRSAHPVSSGGPRSAPSPPTGSCPLHVLV